MQDNSIRLIVFGAHPDDCDIFAGGLASKYVQQGHQVKFVSMTNGDAGHHIQGGGDLAKRRYQETQQAAKVLGIEYTVLDNHDGELLPTLENRRDVIRLIREWEADVVISHRPNDYHPDHRYTSILVQDAAFLVTVPQICPHIPALKKNPYFFYLWDDFKKPYPFQPDVAISVDECMDMKWEMIHCHTSQFYEWLPYLEGNLNDVPDDEDERKRWLSTHWKPFLIDATNSCHEQLRQRYGVEKGNQIEFAETFEICEYGSKPNEDDLKQLFW